MKRSCFLCAPIFPNSIRALAARTASVVPIISRTNRTVKAEPIATTFNQWKRRPPPSVSREVPV